MEAEEGEDVSYVAFFRTGLTKFLFIAENLVKKTLLQAA